jgi:hypothetical protein
MLSHIVIKGNRLSKFVAWTRNVKVQGSEQSSLGVKCKQQARLALAMDIPENIRSTIRGNQGLEILLKLFVKGPNSRNPKLVGAF